MKRLFYLVIFLFPLFSFADEPEGLYQPLPINSQEKRFYIDPTQVGFSDNKIYVDFEGNWQAVDAIYCDNKGIYIKPQYFNYPWKCRICSEINEFWRSTCKTPECEGTRPPKFSIPKPPRPTLPPHLTPEITLPIVPKN